MRVPHIGGSNQPPPEQTFLLPTHPTRPEAQSSHPCPAAPHSLRAPLRCSSVWVWEASLRGDSPPPPQGTAQQFQKNRDLYFFKKKLNKSPALLIGKCYPCPHPHPPFVSLACTPIPPWPQGYLQHGTIEAWGALRQGGGAQGRSPPEGPPKTTQHQQEKLQIRQKWEHHSKVLIYRHRKTSREGGAQMGSDMSL